MMTQNMLTVVRKERSRQNQYIYIYQVQSNELVAKKEEGNIKYQIWVSGMNICAQSCSG